MDTSYWRYHGRHGTWLYSRLPLLHRVRIRARVVVRVRARVTVRVRVRLHICIYTYIGVYMLLFVAFEYWNVTP